MLPPEPPEILPSEPLPEEAPGWLIVPPPPSFSPADPALASMLSRVPDISSDICPRSEEARFM